jgi:hypothetical protein
MERHEELRQAEDTLRRQCVRIIKEYSLTISDLAGILETIKMTFILDQMLGDKRFLDQLIVSINKRQNEPDT